MLLTVKNKIRNAGIKCRNVLANKSGDQMTGYQLIVVLIVVVVGAVFMTPVSRFHNTDLEQYRQQNHRFTELMKILKVNLQMREVQCI